MRPIPPWRLIDHTEENPIVLAGPPRRLVGRVQLHNRGEERTVLREATLHDLPVAHLTAERAKAAQVGTVSMVAILAPGQRATALLRASVDPLTPPGSYAAAAVLGEHSHPVRLEVSENYDISATPTVLIIENEPGGRATRRITFRNDGNVSFRVGKFGALPLDEQLAVCRTIRGTLDENADTAETAAEWLTAFLRQGKKQLDASGLLWVDAPNGSVTVSPGETATIEFLIRMPDTLLPGSRYFAVGYIYNIDLQFVVVPTGAADRPTSATDRPTGTAHRPQRRRN